MRTYPSTTIQDLASILRAGPPAEVVGLLAGLLDSLPIGLYVASCADDFRVLYANRAAEAWISPDKLPLTGRLLEDTIELAEGNGLLELLAGVCLSGEARHLRRFAIPGFTASAPHPDGEQLWDVEAHPLPRALGGVGHILVCAAESASRPAVQPAGNRAHGDRNESPEVLQLFKTEEPLTEQTEPIGDPDPPRA